MTGRDKEQYDMGLEQFISGYIACALYSSTDESRDDGGDPLDDNYSADDLAVETVESMRSECAAFHSAYGHLWTGERQDSDAGRDFWYSRNRHGTGFWDRELAHGDELTKHARAAGERYLYIGDDGKIYCG